MADNIEAVPEKARWEIATKGMTGAYIAISNALRLAVGQTKFEEFNGALWHAAGKGTKEFTDGFGLPTASPGDVEVAMHLFAKAAMGPEFQSRLWNRRKTAAWEGQQSARGTRGGRSRAWRWIVAARGIRPGEMEQWRR